MKAASGIINHLLYLSPIRNLLYVTDVTNGNPSHVFEHLSCFLPGLFALGAHTLNLSTRDKELYKWAASGLAYTCWMTYADHPTGLGPDEVTMKTWPGDGRTDGKWMQHVKAWENAGSPGGLPPGVVEAAKPTMEEDNRDYTARKLEYLLRPEVRSSSFAFGGVP